jgi:hypothetical protein
MNITEQEKAALNQVKANKDISALQGKIYEQEHTITLLRLAVKYGLKEGDTIQPDGSITKIKTEAEAMHYHDVKPDTEEQKEALELLAVS